MGHRVAVKDRILVPQRIVAVMIAEWAFRLSLMRWRVTYERELSFRHQTMSAGGRFFANLSFPPPSSDARTNSGTSSGSGAMPKSSTRADHPGNRDWQRLIHLFRGVIMKAAAFLNLPVQARVWAS